MDFKPRKSLHRIHSNEKNNFQTQKIISYSLSKVKHKPLIKINPKYRSTNIESKTQKSLQVEPLSTKDTSRFSKAKDLYKQFKLAEAYREFEQISKIHPNHEQCLYLLGVTCINLQKPIEAAKYLQRLLHINPSFKQNAYILASIAFNRCKQVQKAIDILTKGIARYDAFFEAYCYRAKLLFSVNKIAKAEEDYNDALSLNPKKSIVLIGKADCLRARGEDKQALNYYNKALQISFNPSILFKRATLYYQTGQYSKCKDDIVLLMQQPTSEILYYLGLLYLNHQHNQAKAIISFEQAVKMNKNQSIQRLCIIQLLKLRINSCDFYECTNILQMAKTYKIVKIAPWEHFVEAVVSMMKKKYKQASKEFELLDKELTPQFPQYEFLNPLNCLYKGYCYFCLNNYQKAYEEYVQYKNYTTTVLGKIKEDPNIVYNTNLFEALMLCESECYEDSLEKLNEMIEQERNFELCFYRIMVIMKIAMTDDPILDEMDSKEEILLYVLEQINQVPQGSSSPTLLYYEAILKAYFGIYSQASKSIGKAIQKAEQNLGRLFHLRGIIQCQLGNLQQSVSDISISLNIEQKPEYYRDRARMYQLIGESQHAYEDLQKFIEIETNDQQISKWAAILLFANKAYEEASRALGKISNIENYPDLKEIKQLIELFEGNFQCAGIQGQTIQSLIEGNEGSALDGLILKKEGVGYFPFEYTYFLRVIFNYCQQKYNLALKDLQLLLFLFGSQQSKRNLILEIKYSIMICHLLNKDIDKAKNQFKNLVQISDTIQQLEQAIANKQTKQFQDLSEHFSYPHISSFLPKKPIPQTNLGVKISIPFPEPFVPNLQIKITQSFLNQRIKVSVVDGKAQAPWIRKNTSGKYQFTNQVISKEISILSSLNNSVLI